MVIENRETAFMESCELERMAALLQSSGRYQILRRLEHRSAYHSPDGTRMHRAIFLDVETTGLDPASDEIIEMAMMPFDFSSDGRIFSVHESFSRFRDPGRPIPAAVAAITGITDEMVAGKSIDPAEIEAFLGQGGRRDRAQRLRPAFCRTLLRRLRPPGVGGFLVGDQLDGGGLHRRSEAEPARRRVRLLAPRSPSRARLPCRSGDPLPRALARQGVTATIELRKRLLKFDHRKRAAWPQHTSPQSGSRLTA
jgi:hypothetical protein